MFVPVRNGETRRMMNSAAANVGGLTYLKAVELLSPASRSLERAVSALS
jgi:hypothetical protein